MRCDVHPADTRPHLLNHFLMRDPRYYCKKYGGVPAGN